MKLTALVDMRKIKACGGVLSLAAGFFQWWLERQNDAVLLPNFRHSPLCIPPKF